MSNHKQHGSLPPLFTFCICSTLLLIAAACAPPAPPPIQTAAPPAEQIHLTQGQHAPGSSQIQILGREFTTAEQEQGQVIYAQYCAACHGADAEGQFPAAPFEPDSTGRIGAPPHDQTGHTWHHSDVLLIRYIAEGGFSDPARFYPMPPFSGVLSEEQILLVLAYIKTLWTDEQRAAQWQLTEDEQRLFSD